MTEKSPTYWGVVTEVEHQPPVRAVMKQSLAVGQAAWTSFTYMDTRGEKRPALAEWGIWAESSLSWKKFNRCTYLQVHNPGSETYYVSSWYPYAKWLTVSSRCKLKFGLCLHAVCVYFLGGAYLSESSHAPSLKLEALKLEVRWWQRPALNIIDSYVDHY